MAEWRTAADRVLLDLSQRSWNAPSSGTLKPARSCPFDLNGESFTIARQTSQFRSRASDAALCARNGRWRLGSAMVCGGIDCGGN